jgi:hypothetical protein
MANLPTPYSGTRTFGACLTGRLREVPSRNSHASCTPKLLPSAIQDGLTRSRYVAYDDDSSKPFAVQPRLTWLHDTIPPVRRTISACRGIVLLPGAICVRVRYADQCLHALEIINIVQKLATEPTDLIHTLKEGSGAILDVSGLHGILHHCSDKKDPPLEVCWKDGYITLEEALARSRSGLVAQFVWQYVILKFCLGMVAALLSHCFHSSLIRKAPVFGFSMVSTFMFLSCTV